MQVSAPVTTEDGRCSRWRICRISPTYSCRSVFSYNFFYIFFGVPVIFGSGWLALALVFVVALSRVLGFVFGLLLLLLRLFGDFLGGSLLHRFLCSLLGGLLCCPRCAGVAAGDRGSSCVGLGGAGLQGCDTAAYLVIDFSHVGSGPFPS